MDDARSTVPTTNRVRFTSRQRRRDLAKLLFIAAGTASFLLSVYLQDVRAGVAPDGGLCLAGRISLQ